MDRIEQLERAHVQVHSQLLQELDRLYFLKEGGSKGTLGVNEKHLLALRRQLQLSLEKSVAAAKTLKRLGDETAGTNSSEQAITLRLKDLMDANGALDEEIADTMQHTLQLNDDLSRATAEFDTLKSQLQNLHPQVTQQLVTNPPETTEEIAATATPQSETLQELLTALQLISGSL
ncbi:Mcm16p KNAG_0F03550 [Huiozyma naganishii CBS 8797]|uniref:Uncharacterized protein n=1 Tax=Huiozyma naganishii (strain ATCC MYA-139 / BCRC 22969 / CBS 8797 / KCTC 17520 / NBRC 10181 / NCYC 3082 / Yp74L-3) TaxID=1071383 RepID=J7S0J6_HUIN7|nr:hypothetical protein KNAG_0F03550 [Kazachstania naganishii CBS 8797]CCK71017.1 hypothetical protein KNAG_0F03550 [Kazachstania naganishii CBS 8797]